MSRTHLLGVLVVVIAVAGVGAALYTGIGPAPGGGSSEEIEEFPTAEDTEADSTEGDSTEADTDDGESGSTGDEEIEPLSFTIDDIAECGSTCRDVTATLDNNQNETESNVTVFIRIFAGEDNTETDDIVWEGTEEAGTIAAGESYTTTERVDLSFQDARKVDEEGWITILTTIESDDTTVTFQDSEEVT